jgi:hypothetical protein
MFSTYLDLGFVDIRRLRALATVRNLKNVDTTYQIANNNLRFSGRSGSRGCSASCSGLDNRSGALLHSSNWGSRFGGIWCTAATTSTSACRAAGAEDLIERLIEFSRHCGVAWKEVYFWRLVLGSSLIEVDGKSANVELGANRAMGSLLEASKMLTRS